MRSEAFYIPEFQRNFVWSQRHASRFIESLLMGLPVPGVFLYKNPEDGKHLVVDGQQRLRTLQFFYSGIFKERKFRLVGVRPEWDNKTYQELNEIDQRKLDDMIVHATIFQQDEPKDTNKSLYFVFERINSGGIRLSPQEIRNCIYDGPFLETVRECNENSNWRNCFGPTSGRQKDQELIVRFFAMFVRSNEYKRTLKDFLNDFCNDYNKESAEKLDNLKNIFFEAIKLCFEAKGKSIFRPTRALNAAVFESVLVGLAKRQQSDLPKITKEEFTKAYDTLLINKEFLKSCESSTATEDAVSNRHSDVRPANSSRFW
ncbi:uncharacterized protein with ParB-like and HNH nuclease domain [Paenochrobactrum gallinarii]|uniref:Uncharacterized protein with ParB-like and HNH nuclease domain n=2 Tax=Paenochrobactrum gallinarii TaxID=643673 RepID=A0A841MB13_9HYPH|nr:uncharacterized protein with ParB-like and HNH nuclease domain [Paenochrobactrum gallinarii]